MGKNKRSKKYYIQQGKWQKTHHNILSPGLTGFLCTCNDRERECVMEAYNILNEYADIMYGKEEIPITDEQRNSDQVEVKSSETTDEVQIKIDNKEKEPEILNKSNTETEEHTKEQPDSSQEETKEYENKNSDPPQKQKDDEIASDSEESLSLDAALKADVEELKKVNEKKPKHLRRFGQVTTGAKNYIFIRSTLEDPLPLSLTIMNDILKQQKQKTKNLIRMIPVQVTCRAYQDDIVKATKNLCESYFREKGESFYIAIKVRNNSSVERESLKLALIKVISEAHSANTPELKDPEVVVNIDVIKNVCCLSLLPGYFTKYSKYNLLSLGNKKESANGVPKDEDNKDSIPEKEAEVK